MTFARQLILSQLGGSLSNSINNLGRAMQEKNIGYSNNDILSNNSCPKSNNEELLKISKTLNKKEITEFEETMIKRKDENKLYESYHEEVNLSNKNINNMIFTIAQKGQKLKMKTNPQLDGHFI